MKSKLTFSLAVAILALTALVAGNPEKKEPKIEYASAIDTEGRMKMALEVSGIPHVILTDPDGVVRWEGFPLLEGEELTEKVVAEILAKYAK